MDRKALNPAAGDTAGGVRDSLPRSLLLDTTTAQQSDKIRRRPISVTVRVKNGEPVVVSGRSAEAAVLLVSVGPDGITSDETSARGLRRMSAYVYALRHLGLPIVRSWEKLGDARVARYAFPLSVQVVVDRGEIECP